MDQAQALEMLGVTQEQLQEKVVAAMVEAIYQRDEDYCTRIVSEAESNIADIVKAEVEKVGDQHIAPAAEKLIAEHVFQKTTHWGEPEGEPLSLTEFLVKSAEAYIQEPVDYEGKARGEDKWGSSREFKVRSSRLTYLIDKHLHYHMEAATKKILETAHEQIAASLKSAMQASVDNAVDSVKQAIKKAR